MNYFLNLYIINHSLLCDGLGHIQPPASLTLPAGHSIGVQLGGGFYIYGWRGRPLLSLLCALGRGKNRSAHAQATTPVKINRCFFSASGADSTWPLCKSIG